MIRLTMANRAADLLRTLDEVESRLAALAVPARRQFESRLALEEVLTNIVKFAYDDDQPHEIALEIDPGEPFVLTVEDDGRPFDPLQEAPAPVLEGTVEDRPVGGFGFYILRRLGMQLDYRRAHGRNRLRVVLPAPPPPGAPEAP
jgi:serine/threonine-protein kinase RsbW